MPEDYETWMSSLDHYRKQYPDADSPTLPTARLSLAKQRIKINSDINNLKSKTMFVAFYSLVGAFIANLTNASYAPFLNGTLGGDCGGAGAGFGSPCQAPAPPGPEWSGRSLRTALEPGTHLGWAEIRHPFHPLRGQRFEVLKQRKVAAIDTLVLRELERGSFSVAREWTDWADPSAYDLLGLTPQRLDAHSLLELVTLLEQLDNNQSVNKRS